jgi:hypothetical protein
MRTSWCPSSTTERSRTVVRTQDGDAQVERFVDFVYQSIKDPAGAVTGIFVEGVDVTDRTLASLPAGL